MIEKAAAEAEVPADGRSERARLDASGRVRGRSRLADGSVDAAVSSFVLQLVPNRFRALREVRRVLRRGGVLRLDQLARRLRSRLAARTTTSMTR